MSDVVIRVENLSKQYRLGVIGHGTLSRDLQSKWARLWGKEDPNTKVDQQLPESAMHERFWALKNVSFDVRRGEIVGIIGKNGAGKSTLLKILSRVTAPTSGSIKIRGRVASLLEVGTGFHPELTGRENILLNGTILGMRRTEIEEKFDEIVRFAEIDKFIDTPVKRYSSGMYVRLAFSVAAHLDPDILLVDEVLAVGDIEFQKKCIGKMGDVAKGGRTVLFVSHNMGVIQRLCTRSVLLSQGLVEADGNTAHVVEMYLSSGIVRQGERTWATFAEAPGNETVRLMAIRALNKEQKITSQFSVRETVYLEVEYYALKGDATLTLAFHLYDSNGALLFGTSDVQDLNWNDKIRLKGMYRIRCEIPGDLLNEGQIKIMVAITTQPRTMHIREDDIMTIQIVDNPEGGGARGNYIGEWPSGGVRPLLDWKTDYIS